MAPVRDRAVPGCSSERLDPLLLVAQSVPTADRIPSGVKANGKATAE